ncbi:hypothetical protein D3C73_1607440 [compost metagenome]
MGKSDLLFAKETDQAIWLVSTGIYLLDPHQCGDIRHAPGMHMKHGSDWHVDVIGT